MKLRRIKKIFLGVSIGAWIVAVLDMLHLYSCIAISPGVFKTGDTSGTGVHFLLGLVDVGDLTYNESPVWFYYFENAVLLFSLILICFLLDICFSKKDRKELM